MMTWARVCRLDDIVPGTGVCALVEGQQVAVFRVGEQVWALSNRDPFSGANVMARGIVGDRNGVLKVSSPVYKHNFALDSGVCLDRDDVQLKTFRARVVDGVVEVREVEK
jgi:nitrite reductase (NADH) small subunit